MNQVTQTPKGSPLLDHCPETLPAAWYYDADHHALELKRIWARQWVHVGRVKDLPAMTLRRIEVAGENLMLVKDQAGQVSCFHNVCRHRGSEICLAHEQKLKTKLITCPYHAWSYDLAGKLVRTPFVSETADFDKAYYGLIPVHVKLWNGLIFVCLAYDPPAFEKAPDLGASVLDNWPMEDLVSGHRLVKEMACNWKIFWENYNECLHCPGIHPELCEMVPIYGKGYMAANEAPDWTPEQGASGTELKAGAKSWTMNGLPCGPEFPKLTAEEREKGQTFVTLYPTCYIVAHVDYVRIVTLRPLGPERTELCAEWLFPEETLKMPGFDPVQVTDFATMVMMQDGAACEMNQKGLKSSAFKGGRLMPQEFDVHGFQNWVRRQVA
ncbi:MAG: aromatic ring-hydroxylating dioxygenase subunit alpha [Proteobacteria bacterium]|nr:aromatic ring-hydroxylating dioxygenase subunit alpha [Pseudomonadota bacterium]